MTVVTEGVTGIVSTANAEETGTLIQDGINLPYSRAISDQHGRLIKLLRGANSQLLIEDKAEDHLVNSP